MKPFKFTTIEKSEIYEAKCFNFLKSHKTENTLEIYLNVNIH